MPLACATRRGDTIRVALVGNRLVAHTIGLEFYNNFKYKPAIEVSGNSEINNNVIVGPGRDLTTSDGYGIKVEDNYSYISGNVFFDYDTAINAEDDATIRENLLVNNSRVIVITRCNVVVRNNTITDAPVTIKFSECPMGEIVYNNFENYNQYSIYFETSSSNFDFTNNWWGLTDTQAINLTIRDFKYDFSSAKVNFVPFLTEPNSEALPNSSPEFPTTIIPEFPSWLLLPLFLAATFAVIVVRKRLVC